MNPHDETVQRYAAVALQGLLSNPNPKILDLSNIEIADRAVEVARQITRALHEQETLSARQVRKMPGADQPHAPHPEVARYLESFPAGELPILQLEHRSTMVRCVMVDGKNGKGVTLAGEDNTQLVLAIKSHLDHLKSPPPQEKPPESTDAIVVDDDTPRGHAAHH